MGKRGIKMKNAIRTMNSLIRANPEFARLAITLDAIIGITFGLFVYVCMNAANIELTNILVLGFAAALVLVAVGIAGYTHLYKTGYDFGDVDFEDCATDYDVDMDREREE
jgi:hypothetical protein